MFKKKKTYIDKIDFDVFEDERPDDFDLFGKENPDEDFEDEVTETEDKTEEEIEQDNEENEVSEVEETDEDEDAEIDEVDESEELEADETDEVDDHEDEEIEEEVDDNEDDSDSEDDNDDETKEKIGFTYDDFYNIDKEIKDKKKDKEGKKGGSKLVWFALLWIVMFSAGVFAFLYFKTDLFKKKTKQATVTDAVTTTESTETTEELDENFYTIYSYQTNADVNINALMADYYDALVKGDRDKLKDIVTEPEAFGDMVIYETKAQVISEYSNITCYTIPGLNEGEILVFTTSNVTITGVNSKPLDIKQFYVVKDGNNYKINNGVLSQETIDYINVQAGSPDVQALYRSVQDNINKCLAEDSTFADFYNKISTNTDAEQEQ